jgi:hypothetical protein
VPLLEFRIRVADLVERADRVDRDLQRFLSDQARKRGRHRGVGRGGVALRLDLVLVDRGEAMIVSIGSGRTPSVSAWSR